MEEFCDMHIHTNHSDGNLSGSELLQYAARRELKKLSITDHDCVDFYLDEKIVDRLKDFDYVTGCEFVCSYGNVPIEILGYGIDVIGAKEYLNIYGINENKIEKYRSDHTPKVFAKYGIILDYDPKSIDFTQKCPMVLEQLYESVLRNQEAVNFLEKENPRLLQSVSTFLREGLNNPASKIFIAPHTLYPSYDKITTLIKKLGGISFLAHPYQYGDNMERVLEGTKNSVNGIECYHYTTTEKAQTEYLKSFCEKNGLMISGGSDFHIKDPMGKDLLNKLNVPAQYFDKIKTRVKTITKTNLAKNF
ncbi:MAG: hypothetical protein J6J24_04280 [Clostridia bacterium]|nr:hypothetical protein [Clostridia bacterium]